MPQWFWIEKNTIYQYFCLFTYLLFSSKINRSLVSKLWEVETFFRWWEWIPIFVEIILLILSRLISKVILIYFENDVNFEAVKLWCWRNSVFVNSFTECHHYANGGWNYTPTLKWERLSRLSCCFQSWQFF